MKALILTYDNNRRLTEHMIYKYRQVWPDHPFVFHVPYQINDGHGERNCRFLKSPADIKGTVLTLLSGLDRDEWIYWCIDDKYPIDLDLAGVKSVYSLVRGIDDSDVSGIMFCRPRKLQDNKYLTGKVLKGADGIKCLERSRYDAIWIHQFLRVKVLKHLFESFPDVIPSAKIMDELKYQIKKPADHRLFVVSRNMAVFGESASRGVLTKNCYHSLLEAGLYLPDWHTGNPAKMNIIGEMPRSAKKILRDLLNLKDVKPRR